MISLSIVLLGIRSYGRGNRNRINNTRRIFEIHTAHRGVSSEVEGGFGDTITKCYGNIQVASTKASTPQINPRRSIEERMEALTGDDPMFSYYNLYFN